MHKSSATIFALFFWLCSFGQQTNIEKLYEEGFAAYRKGEKQKAIEVFEKIYALDSTETDALDYKTILYHQTGQYEKAADGCVMLCKIFPEKDDIFCSASFNYALIKKPGLAEAFAQRAVMLNASYYNNMLNLAHACLFLRKGKQAIYWYTRAMEYVPSIDAFERSFLGDFQLFDSLKLYPTDRLKTLGSALLEKYNTYTANPLANQLLDSIFSYQYKKLSYPDKEKIMGWKKEFLATEQAAIVPRRYLVAAFTLDLGLQEFRNRNRTIAFDEYFKKARDIYLDMGDSLEYTRMAIFLSKELMVYQNIENKYGENPLVLQYALEGLASAERNKITELKSPALKQLADAYLFDKKEQQAFEWLHQLLQWSKQTHDGVGFFQATNGLSVYHGNQDRNDSALFYNTLCLKKIDSAWLNPGQITRIKLNGLEIMHAQGKYREAIAKAQKLKKETAHGSNTYYSSTCDFIGSCYESLKITDSAYAYYKEAVLSYIRISNEIEQKGKEQLPVQVNEELENAIWSLCEIAAARNNAKDLFYWSEIIKDNSLRYLISFQYQPDNLTTLAKAKAALPADAVAINYTGSNLRNSASCLAFDNTTQQVLRIHQQDISKLVKGKNLSKTMAKLTETMQKNSAGATDSGYLLQSLPLMHFMYLCNADPSQIRGIAIKRKESTEDKALTEEKLTLSKLLYSIYVAPFEKLLTGKKKLMISADFLLQFIPFETLMMPDGRYLGEVYDITYVPGFTINELLAQRTYYEGDKIIAIGNPDYSTYHPEKLQGRALDFSQLGITSWTDLPGTEKELNTLQSYADSAIILSGTKLSETGIKQMSRESLLLKAGILHFALHGIAGSASAAEDNSLVVTEPDGGSEDGLLQFYEAFELDIRPRLVCLSACQTGLGMLEKDGSLVTMGTAFLAAGAKAVLATNWSIDDAATALFIKEVYSQVREQKISFATAVANAKRKFIKGDFGEKYKQPIYWAPFKYYGN